MNTYYDDGYAENTINLSYDYLDSNNHNNGNVMKIANGLDNNISQSFGYDSLNRLTSAQTASTYSTSQHNCWGENYSYDAWGNLTKLAQMQGGYTGCYSESGFDFTGEITGQNQISSAAGYNYDSAGNLMQITGSGGATYSYDAENHLISTGGVTYTYDGDGKRVMKSSGVIYWYGQSSAPLMETDFSNNMDYVYMYLNGQRLARRNYGNEIDWYESDALGNARFLGGSNVTYYSDFYPFGGERAIYEDGYNQPCPFGCNPVPSNYLFTGKERDSESNLDQFGARYYSSSIGRFMTPDWAAKPTAVPYANFGNPQSLNLYSYVKNNPTTTGDPDGHCPWCLAVAGGGVLGKTGDRRDVS